MLASSRLASASSRPHRLCLSATSSPTHLHLSQIGRLRIVRLVSRLATTHRPAQEATFGLRRPQPPAVLGSFRDLIASFRRTFTVYSWISVCSPYSFHVRPRFAFLDLHFSFVALALNVVCLTTIIHCCRTSLVFVYDAAACRWRYHTRVRFLSLSLFP